MRKPKLMVIGLDAVSLTLLDVFKRHCPTIRRQMARGVSGRALPCFPVYTPTNWAALSTGADSSTTGAEGWYRDMEGRRLSTFDRRAIASDTIFDAAARAGMKTLAISYPSAHPTRSDSNMVLAPLDRGLVSRCVVAGKVLEVSEREGIFPFVLVEAPKTAAGAVMAKAVGATEDGVEPGEKGGPAPSRQVRAFLFRLGRGRWKLGFDPDPRRASITLRNEVWSEAIPVAITIPHGPGQCVLRVMVFDNGKRLAVSEAYDIGALGKPAALARDVYRKLGPPIEHSVFFHEMERLFHKDKEDDLLRRLARAELVEQAKWIVEAARLAQKATPYDVFYHHCHYPDNVMHQYLAAAEGVGPFTPRQQRLAREALATCFEICDHMIAGLLKLAGPQTTVLLVSDHGDVPNRYSASLPNRLLETGLTVRDKDGRVDRQKSLAWPSPRVGTWVEVNAAPGGARHEALQAAVIDALLDWKAETGERVVALALRRKDSHLLGYHGADCADVTCQYNSGFFWGPCPPTMSVVPCTGGANHGPQMPVTFSKISDNMAFFVLTGPGVKKAIQWDAEAHGPIRLVDLLPTACHISGAPTPRTVTPSSSVKYILRKFSRG